MKKAPALRFKGFTNDWEQRKLGEIAKTYSGGTPSISNKKFYINGHIPFIKSGEIGSTRTEQKINYDGLNNSSARLIETGTLLYALYGATSGNAAISPIDGAINQAVLAIIPQNNVNRFIYEWLNKNKSRITGKYLQGGQGNLSAKIIKQINIYITSKNEELKISNILRIVNKIISLQQRELELLKLFKIGMLQNILADTKAASKLKFKGSNQEWRPRRLNSITNIITKGTTPHFKQASNGVNFIKIEDISKDNGKIYPRSFITEKENNGYLKRSQLKAGDLLFSIAGTLGRVGKVTDDILPANTNQALAIIRLKPSQNIDFCKIMLESDSVERYIHANPTMGAQPNLSLKQISDLTLFFPDIKEQTLISQLIKKIDNLLALQYQNISKFKQLKQFLLQNIFI